jgi:hypothetical protein
MSSNQVSRNSNYLNYSSLLNNDIYGTNKEKECKKLSILDGIVKF